MSGVGSRTLSRYQPPIPTIPFCAPLPYSLDDDFSYIFRELLRKPKREITTQFPTSQDVLIPSPFLLLSSALSDLNAFFFTPMTIVLAPYRRLIAQLQSRVFNMAPHNFTCRSQLYILNYFVNLPCVAEKN